MSEALRKLQDAVLSLPQIALETQHFRADGMYLRWVARPKGTLIVGLRHKREHFYLVVKGTVQLAGEGESVTYRAPAVIVCQPGNAKAVLALEDSVCLTVHRTQETELAAIEADLVEPDTRSLYGPGNTLKALT